MPYRRSRHIVFFLALFSTLVATSAYSLEIANSVDEFSDIQGANNWEYGYYLEPTGNDPAFWQSTWLALPVFNTTRNVWEITPRPDQGGDYWTIIRDVGGHPNWGNNGARKELHWAVRRWISEVDGEINIAGDYGSGNSARTTQVRIIVDGNQVFESPSRPGGSYNITVDVNVGSLVDFAIDPKGSDVSDNTRFTAIISINDSDNDGVQDSMDECPNSDLRSNIIIANCDSGVTNHLQVNGCTISDEIDNCAAGANNHGNFASCVSNLTNTLKKSGLISGAEKGAIQSCAAQVDIP